MPVIQRGILGWWFQDQGTQAALYASMCCNTFVAGINLTGAFLANTSCQAFQPGLLQWPHGRAAPQIQQQRGLRDNMLRYVRAGALESLQAFGYFGEQLPCFGLLVGAVALQLVLNLPQ